MSAEMSDELKNKILIMFKAKQEQDEAQKRIDIEQKIRDSTCLNNLIRSVFDDSLGCIRHGIVYQKDGEEKVFFRGEIPNEGFTPVLVPNLLARGQ